MNLPSEKFQVIDNLDSKLPPIKLSTLLRYAWGMTMNLSNQSEQNKLGEDLKSRLDNLIKDYASDPKARAFLSEVSLVLIGLQRSYGFQREVYITNINELKELKNSQLSYYMGLSNIMPAVNTGYSGNTTGSYGSSYGSSPTNTPKIKTTFNNTLNKIIAFVGSGSATASFAQLLFSNWGSTMAEQLKQELAFTIFRDATIFIIAGAVTYGVYTFFANRYAYKKIKKIQMEESQALIKFWKFTMKPILIDMYVDFSNELRNLLMRHYGTKDDGSLPTDEDELKKFISKQILPNDNCYQYRPLL